MAKVIRTTLKNYFQTGDKPSQAQYADFIDSKVNLAETDLQVMNGPLSASSFIAEGEVIAGTNVSASGTVHTTDLTVTSLGSMQVPFIEAGSGGNFNGSGLFTFLAGVLTVPEITEVKTGNVEVIGDGHITASGNISASNKILGLTGSFGRLEATTSSFSKVESLNISASGNIIANSGSFNYIESINKIRHTGDINTEVAFGLDTVIIRAGLPDGSSRENFRAGSNFTRIGNDTTPTHISGSVVGIPLATLPTSDPNIAGRLWRDGTDLKISLG